MLGMSQFNPEYDFWPRSRGGKDDRCFEVRSEIVLGYGEYDDWTDSTLKSS
jgi:hypothetical protein